MNFGCTYVTGHKAFCLLTREPSSPPLTLFGPSPLFDGHFGTRAATFLAQYLLPELSAKMSAESMRIVDWHKQVFETFKAVDNELLQAATADSFEDGATACVLLVSDSGNFLCANC